MEDHCNYDGGYRVPCDGYDATRLTLSDIADRLGGSGRSSALQSLQTSSGALSKPSATTRTWSGPPQQADTNGYV